MAIAFTYLTNWSNTDHGNVVISTGGTYNLEDATLRPGVRITLVNKSTAVTVTPVATQTVNGAATYTLAAATAPASTSVTLLSDGHNWHIVATH